MAIVDVNTKYEEMLREMFAEKGIKCTSCGSPTRLSVHKRVLLHRCSWKGCAREASIWEDTIFSKRKTDPERILYALELWLDGLKISQVAKITHISKYVVHELVNKLNKIF
ncbi:hypothetical protein ENBRE01_1990 [Enteropsectra breve]|nr:hypothetical protein ENBRE01_1990 [Enteropsectra breve]